MRYSLPLFAVVVLFFTACAPTPQSIVIDTLPPGARVTVNDSYVGESPVEYDLVEEVSDDSGHVKRIKDYTILVEKEGYFAEKAKYSKRDMKKYADKPLKVDLNVSPMWSDTTGDVAANEWHYIMVNPYLKPEDVWQRLVDTLTKQYITLEQMDPASGYIKSSEREKIYQTDRGVFRLRNQFVTAIDQHHPLKYKIKVLANWSMDGVKWHPYSRMFKEEGLLVEEIKDRFKAP